MVLHVLGSWVVLAIVCGKCHRSGLVRLGDRWGDISGILQPGKERGLPHPPNPPQPPVPCSPFQPSYLPSPYLDRLLGTCWALSCCRSSWTTAEWTQVSVWDDAHPSPVSRSSLPVPPPPPQPVRAENEALLQMLTALLAPAVPQAARSRWRVLPFPGPMLDSRKKGVHCWKNTLSALKKFATLVNCREALSPREGPQVLPPRLPVLVVVFCFCFLIFT